MAASGDDLPDDIIPIILLNLPAKSLHRFKAVCKSWNALISDRVFVKTHHQNSKNNTRFKFLCTRGMEEELCLYGNKNGDFGYEPLPQQQPCGDVLCYGDGLVLLSSKDKQKEEEEQEEEGGGYSSYVLWNPSSRKQKKFSCSPVIGSCANNHLGTHFGFCHDPSLDDYKVVIRYDKTYYAVFSCRNKSWTTKQNKEEETNYDNLYPEAGLLVDGFSFWILEDRRGFQTKEIIYFDPRDDKFHKLKTKPEGTFRAFSLTSLGGCLCAYENIFTRKENCIRLRVWIMKGHVDMCSWSELLDIKMLTPVPRCIVWPMFFWENAMALHVNRPEYRICGSSTNKKAFCTLLLDRFQIRRDFPMVLYQDSLFFPIQD